MVLNLVSGFLGLIKVRLHTNIDSNVFRLHYRWTTSLYFLACVLVTATEYIGSAIQCIGPKGGDDSSPKAVNTYCWIASTHTFESYNANVSRYHSRGTTFDGLGHHKPGTPIKYHTYYQWVPFFLFFQGCLFYLPHYIWKSIEGKTAHNLLQGLQFFSIDADRDKKIANIVKYMRESRGHNKNYAIVYLLCEALNLVNVIGQMMLLDKFLGGDFLDFGHKVLYPKDANSAPLIWTFPRVTRCPFHYFGTGGSISKEDYMCLLPQNILNEKIFIFMWFWLILLATVTAIELVWRIAVAISPMVRIQLIERRGKLTADPKLEQVMRFMDLGDYCLLDILATNLDANNFQNLLLSLTECYDTSIHPKGDTSYRPYSHLDEVDGNGIIMEARV